MIIGTSYQKSATRVLLLGSGELGKEVAIECVRLGIEVIACDKYENAPAMHVAQRSHVFNMLDGDELRRVIELEKPDYIVPEIEAIATNTLLKLEQEGFHVVPCANATALTMNREGIRRLASEELGLATSPYCFADTLEAVIAAATQIGFPCVIKPVMSSSGKGQSIVHSMDAISSAWEYAQDAGRAGKGRVIIEGFIDFDYEITQLTIHSVDGFHFCAPIGHRQEKGDYRESWQPHYMSDIARAKAQNAAQKVVEALGGYGIFGVELFIKGDNVYFNEVSPRPHDTGLVTLLSQDLSEFALHVRAFLGLPITQITHHQASASVAILGDGISRNITFSGLAEALSVPSGQLRLFGKPEINGSRRLGVALAAGVSIEDALEKALKVAACVKVSY